jgi:hypothetical protein
VGLDWRYKDSYQTSSAHSIHLTLVAIWNGKETFVTDVLNLLVRDPPFGVDAAPGMSSELMRLRRHHCRTVKHALPRLSAASAVV